MTNAASPQSPLPSLVIVRHGETDWNIGRRIQGRTEVPLNHTGRAQAAEAARILAAEAAAAPATALNAGGEQTAWSEIITSPLGRAAETATIIAAELGLAAPRTDASVLERDFGEAEGMLVADALELWPTLDAPGAETIAELGDRGGAALTALLAAAPGSIVVAHGALIRAALSAVSGTEAPRILNGEAWRVTAADPEGGDGFATITRLGAPSMQHPW